MKVCITGNKGFIGSYFEKRLQDHDLTLVDIADGRDAIDFFRNDSTQFDLVVHCAAVVGGRLTIDGSPAKLFGNFGLDSEMLMWALRNKPHKIIYFSSSAAYPNQLQRELDCHTGQLNQYRLKESDVDLDNVRNPDQSIYGWSKLTGEQMIRYVKNELNVWIFRPFSGYSELQSLDYPFPSFIHRAVTKADPFDIWSTGRQCRDWIHIDDIVNATLEITFNSDPVTVNLCTGVPTSFNDFADRLTKRVGYSPEFNRKIDAPVGVHYRLGDPTFMNTMYKAKISLDEGIDRALRCFDAL